MMMNKKIKRILASPYSVATAFFIFFIAFYLHFYYQSASSHISTANSSYIQGEHAITVAERKSAFNKALDEYLTIEKSYEPIYGNGKLYYNIGNTYYQLGEYPMAVLYYYRALSLSPYDSRVGYNLNAALKKLDLPPPEKQSAFAKVFFFHALLPLPQRLQLFFFLALVTLFFASYHLWVGAERTKLGTLIVGGMTVLMLLSLSYSYYLENSDAIVTKGTYLYRGAGKNFATVEDKPLKAGSRVEIFQSETDGTWLKVQAQNGEVGYVPHESLRLIF